MPNLTFRHSSSARRIGAVRPGLILGIILALVLTACGDQNTPVTSQGTAVGGQVSTTSQGQAQAAAASKTTPKPATAAKGPAGTVHICSLLTKDEVAANIGGTGVEVQASRDALGEFGAASCDYTSGTGALSVQVTITDESQAEFEKNSQALNAQAVPSSGDASFYQAGLLNLSTLKGKILVTVMLLNPAKGTQTVSNATALTQQILTSLAKTSFASDLTTTGAAGKGKPVTAIELPVYPGSVQVKNESVSSIQIATFTSTDDYTTIVSWYKKAVANKTWTGSTSFEPEVDYSIISAGKSTADTASQLSVSIEGPKKAGRSAGSDANGNPIVLGPNSTLIIMTLT
jgi:hypothetical protein